MERMRANYADELIEKVEYLDDPQVVADLILLKRAEEFRYYKGWGGYLWNGQEWEKIFDKDVNDWTNREVLGFARNEVGDLLVDLDYVPIEPSRDTPLWMAIKEAQENLSNLLSNTQWLLRVGWGVVYGGCYDEGDIRLTRQHEDLLKTRGFLSVANGVIDLKTGDLYYHDNKKDLFFTRVLQTKYNPEVKAPSFFKALEILTNGNTVLAEYLQWALGSAITGYKTYSNVFWFYGAPHTRKELLLQIVADILEDYSIMVPHTAFKHAHVNKVLLEKLHNKRMLYCINYPNGAPMTIGALKSLCERDYMVIYWHFKEHYACSLTNVFVASDGFPVVLKDTASFLARVRPILFKPSRNCYKLFDKDFERKIMEEKEGILAWLVEGAKKYLSNPTLTKPDWSFYDLANNMKEEWIEKMKKPLPTRKGQTNTKTRQ